MAETQVNIRTNELLRVVPLLPFSSPHFVRLAGSGPNSDVCLRAIKLPHGVIWLATSEVGFVGKAGIPRGYHFFALSMPGSKDFWHSKEVEPLNQLAWADSESGFHHRTRAPHHSLAWMVETSRYQLAAEVLGLEFSSRLSSSPWLSGNTAVLRSLVEQFFLQPEGRELGREAAGFLEGCLVQAVLHFLNQSRAVTSIRPNPRLSEKVRGWLERAEEPVSMLQLCHEFRVPERTLRGAFCREFGMSPICYHQLVRMNRVRDELLQQQPKRGAVSRAATRAGFWHMGRFSQQYKKLFGETPSETMTRQRTTIPSYSLLELPRLPGV